MPRLQWSKLYALFVTTTGSLLLVSWWPALRQHAWEQVAFFSLLALAAEAMPVTLPRRDGTVSVSFAVFFATIIVLGPEAAAWVAAIGSIRVKDLRGQTPIDMVLFNRGMVALVAGLSGLAYRAAGGTVGAVSALSDVVPLALCAVVYALTNVTFVVFFLALRQKMSIWGVWALNLKWLLPNYLALAPIGSLLASSYLRSGPVGIGLFFLPLLMARYSFQRFIDMRRMYLDTVRALTTALEAKDPYTKGHSERVAQLSVKLGRKMNLPEDQVELLEYVGLLHDIGKIGVRDSVLKKPGIFASEEYAEMQRHPVIGGQIIRDIRLLGKAASWVRYHHERWDGAGFPDGLAGEEIPLGARIIAVCDAFDAITSERPYKRAFSIAEARREVVKGSGTQFDPAVVSALMEVTQAEYEEELKAVQAQAEAAASRDV